MKFVKLVQKTFVTKLLPLLGAGLARFSTELQDDGVSIANIERRIRLFLSFPVTVFT
jgi:hypothetical protein